MFIPAKRFDFHLPFLDLILATKILMALNLGFSNESILIKQESNVPDLSAYHEAGHALIAIHVGARVRSVTINPDWDDGPERYADIRIEWPIDRFPKRELAEKSVFVALAGPVAEMIYSGEPYHPGFVAEWAFDWKLAWEAASALRPSERQRLAYLEQVTAQLYRLLNRDDYWAALAAVVDNLLAHETLEGEEVEDIVRQWLGN